MYASHSCPQSRANRTSSKSPRNAAHAVTHAQRPPSLPPATRPSDSPQRLVLEPPPSDSSSSSRSASSIAHAVNQSTLPLADSNRGRNRRRNRRLARAILSISTASTATSTVAIDRPIGPCCNPRSRHPRARRRPPFRAATHAHDVQERCADDDATRARANAIDRSIDPRDARRRATRALEHRRASDRARALTRATRTMDD